MYEQSLVKERVDDRQAGDGATVTMESAVGGV
jgi:hypothetical protein